MNAREQAQRAARHLAQKLATVGIVALAQIYGLITKTRPRTLRRLAGSPDAQAAREAAEQQLRAVIHAYGALPSLTLRLVAIEDMCSGGGGWTLATDSTYKVSCTLYATAYYTTGRDMNIVLDNILTAGDPPCSLIAFNHSAQPRTTRKSHWLCGIGQTLTWDIPAEQVVDEVRPCTRKSDPPTYRCLREGDHPTVAAMRSTFGTVLKVDLSPVTYFRVDR
ncbi:hypothetical protein ACFWMU_18065 [Streptomyces sp. NPDC058357]|uniref:hypothetical protein n=1 Tax=unclassified Streptomyces TaxID=2593676 RepID=UPI003658C465